MRCIRPQSVENFKEGTSLINEPESGQYVPWVVYNGATMNKIFLMLTLAAAATGCNKSSGPAAAAAPDVSSKPSDVVQQKLVELTGKDATNCGRFAVQAPEAHLKTASDCAMQAANSKKPFYVGYDMPGMTVAVAGAVDGKLYSVQIQESGPVTSEPCPSELRVAPSGRVTCFAPGAFGGGAMGSNPHTGMTMPPSGGTAPGGMMNPHELIPPAAQGAPNPHKGAAKPPAKQQ